MIKETDSFFTILLMSYKYGGDVCQHRRTRAGDIVFLRWGLEKKDIYNFFFRNGDKMTNINTVRECAQHIREPARLILFTLCMDILSSGAPLGHKEYEYIEALKNALSISENDYNVTMAFCNNRMSALGVEWKRKTEY
ncbi:MAG: hypothetical protein KF862_07295 [Chitinophagaceae bacterium]|nr:hypothetical protein [Chitinophagaceae bacterium]